MSNQSNTSMSEGQKARVAALVAEAARSALEELDLPRAAAQKLFVERGGDLKRGVKPLIAGLLRSLTAVFNPAAFIGEGWSFSEEDRLPLAPAGIDPEAIEFVNMLRGKEVSIKGRERDKRLRKAGRLHLGPDHFLRYWKMRDHLPESWKKIGPITFDAIKLRSPDGSRAVLCMFWRDGVWDWVCCWLNGAYDDQDLSAVAGR